MQLLTVVKELATRKGCTPAQLALAWLLRQGKDTVPIPGTKRRTYLQDNVAAAKVLLTVAELDELNRHLPVGMTAGNRYPDQAMAMLDR